MVPLFMQIYNKAIPYSSFLHLSTFCAAADFAIVSFNYEH